MKNQNLLVFTFWVCLSLTPVFGQLNYTASWIGNTYPKADEHVPQFADDMFVLPNGIVATNSHWDEGGKEFSIFNTDGTPFINTRGINGLKGYGRGGGYSVTANSTHFFVTMWQDNSGSGTNVNGKEIYPPSGTRWFCVRKYALDGVNATFSGNGVGQDGSMIVVDQTNNIVNQLFSKPLRGVAATDTELYVSDAAANKIKVYNPSNGAFIREFDFTNPDEIALGIDNTLWIIQNNGSSGKVFNYSNTGSNLNKTITSVASPTDVSVDPNNKNTVLVADGSQSQQVFVFDAVGAGTPSQLTNRTIGIYQGLFSGSAGVPGPEKFYHPQGAGLDVNGNIYVCFNDLGYLNEVHEVGCHIRKLNSSKQKQWEKQALLYLDVLDMDPDNNELVYSTTGKYSFNFDAAAGSDWTYEALTVNPLVYPQDARVICRGTAQHSNARIIYLNVNGVRKKYLFTLNSAPNTISIYKFNGEIAVPCGVWTYKGTYDCFPNMPRTTNSYYARDSNGNGSFESSEYTAGIDFYSEVTWAISVDDNGNIWVGDRDRGQGNPISIYRFPVTGFDSNENPIYNVSTSTSNFFEISTSLLSTLQRVKYDVANDIMYLSGYNSDWPSNTPENGLIGRILVRINNWSTGNRTPAYAITDFDEFTNNQQTHDGIAIAGDLLFVGTTERYLEPTQQARAYIKVYKSSDGSFLGTMKPPVEWQVGWLDLTQSIEARKTGANRYVVFQEDDGVAKNVVYKLTYGDDSTPPVTIRVNSGGSSAGSFATDNYFSGGTAYSSSNTISTANVANAAPASIYQTHRWGNMSYGITGLNAGRSYTVRLHFAESYCGVIENCTRQFDVKINGLLVWDDLNVAAIAGTNKALVKDATATANASGRITVDFTTVVGNPFLSGIEVLEATTGARIGSNDLTNAFFTAYPNPLPNQSLLSLRFNGYSTGTAAIRVYTLTGQLVHQEKASILDKNETVHVVKHRFKSGFYLITIQSLMGIQTQKLLIE